MQDMLDELIVYQVLNVNVGQEMPLYWKIIGHNMAGADEIGIFRETSDMHG